MTTEYEKILKLAKADKRCKSVGEPKQTSVQFLNRAGIAAARKRLGRKAT